MNIPLAERLRPKALEDYISQQHLVGKDGMLYQQIKSGVIPSLILWGPPGIGKTTLANIIANESGRPFFKLSAINSGVKDIREVIDKARYCAIIVVYYLRSFLQQQSFYHVYNYLLLQDYDILLLL